MLRCSLAVETVSPEVTAKELIAEVAQQETNLRGVEATLHIQKPIEEVRNALQESVLYSTVSFFAEAKLLSPEPKR